MIQRRVMREVEHERWRLSLSQLLREAIHSWHGVKLNQPDWSSGSHNLAISAELKNEGLLLFVILNAYWEALEFELPIPRKGAGNWRWWIDTALDPPEEICEWSAAAPVPSGMYHAGARSVVVLIANESVNRGH